jgi:hypothetical protein
LTTEQWNMCPSSVVVTMNSSLDASMTFSFGYGLLTAAIPRGVTGPIIARYCSENATCAFQSVQSEGARERRLPTAERAVRTRTSTPQRTADRCAFCGPGARRAAL